LVCGSREWVAPAPILRELAELMEEEPNLIVIHGAACGADRLAGQVAAMLGIDVIEVPAEWDQHGRAAGPIRNQKMLDMEPDLVLAFHERMDLGKGTRDMVTRARKAGVEVEVYHA
jgi:hypothetical protein